MTNKNVCSLNISTFSAFRRDFLIKENPKADAPQKKRSFRILVYDDALLKREASPRNGIRPCPSKQYYNIEFRAKVARHSYNVDHVLVQSHPSNMLSKSRTYPGTFREEIPSRKPTLSEAGTQQKLSSSGIPHFCNPFLQSTFWNNINFRYQHPFLSFFQKSACWPSCPQVCALSDVSKKMKHDETCDFSDHLSSSFFVPIKMSETLTCGPAPSVGSGDCEPKITAWWHGRFFPACADKPINR